MLMSARMVPDAFSFNVSKPVLGLKILTTNLVEPFKSVYVIFSALQYDELALGTQVVLIKKINLSASSLAL